MGASASGEMPSRSDHSGRLTYSLCGFSNGDPMMKLPVTNDSPVLRTDFSDQAAWDAIRAQIQQPSPEGFEAHVEFIDDRAFAAMSAEQILAAVPADYPHTGSLCSRH